MRPDPAKETPQAGEVVAVGPGAIKEERTDRKLLSSGAVCKFFYVL